MTEYKYVEPAPLTNEEIEQAFQHGNTSEISETLVALALYDPNWKKIQAYCLKYLEHPDSGVRAVAATCIGHLARIHQRFDLDIVLPALYRHQSDPGKYVAGNVDNALSDIEMFMDIPVKRDPKMRHDMVIAVNIEDEAEDEDEA
jgi:hypothetical protein